MLNIAATAPNIPHFPSFSFHISLPGASTRRVTLIAVTGKTTVPGRDLRAHGRRPLAIRLHIAIIRPKEHSALPILGRNASKIGNDRIIEPAKTIEGPPGSDPFFP